MMRRSNRYSALLALTITLAMTSCGDGEGDAGQGESESVITLASPVDLTGDSAGFGPGLIAGVELAVQEVNDAGGIEVDGKTYTFEIDSRDTQSDANQGLAYARGAIADGRKFFLPATGSIVGVGMSEFVSSEANKAILMMASGVLGARMNEETAAEPPGKYTFITNSGTAVFAQSAVNATKEQFGDPKVSLLVQNDPVGVAYSDALHKGFEEAGITAAETVFYDTGTTDFSATLARIKSEDPDVVLMWYEPTQNLPALKQAIELDVANEGYYMTSGVAALRDAVGTIPAGMTILTQPAGGIPTDDEGTPPELKEFIEGINAVDPDLKGTAGAAAAAGPYIAVHTLAAALEEAGTVTDTDAIVEALESVSVNSPLGELSYNASHILRLGSYVCVVTSEPATCEQQPAPN